MRHRFPFNNVLLKHAEVADLQKISNKSFVDVQYFLNRFPVMCLQNEDESEDEARDKLQSEFCCLQIDDIHPC